MVLGAGPFHLQVKQAAYDCYCVFSFPSPLSFKKDTHILYHVKTLHTGVLFLPSFPPVFFFSSAVFSFPVSKHRYDCALFDQARRFQFLFFRSITT